MNSFYVLKRGRRLMRTEAIGLLLLGWWVVEKRPTVLLSEFTSKLSQ